MRFGWNRKKYEKIDYPVREKREVQLFDIREFVKEKKKEIDVPSLE